MVDGREQVRLVDRAVDHAVQAQGIEPGQLALVVDVQNSDVSSTVAVLKFACAEECLLLRAVHGQDHKLEMLPAKQELGGDAVVGDFQLVIRTFGAEDFAD